MVCRYKWCADVLICTTRHQLNPYLMQRGTFAYHYLHPIIFPYHDSYTILIRNCKLLCKGGPLHTITLIPLWCVDVNGVQILMVCRCPHLHKAALKKPCLMQRRTFAYHYLCILLFAYHYGVQMYMVCRCPHLHKEAPP